VAVSSPALAADPVDPIGRYLSDLEHSRRLPAEEVSLETLKDGLRRAEDRLVRGDARAATTLLYAVVESPRYAPWKDSPSFQNAEFLLGRALARGGAHLSAERYLLRLLARGPDAPYFVPAHRALVDLALETRSYGRLAEILAARSPLPPDSASEVAYLRGRVAYDARDLAGAATQFAAVERRSRLYPAAAYFRGLVAARQRQWGMARDAFCEIVDQRDKGKVAFTVDGRYFGLKELAQLALGRIAHEQGSYDEAYYFYFSVPEESEYLAEALYEASWSMYQKGELDAARAFIDQFDRLFPRSPLRAEVAILRAHLDLRSCAFDRARSGAGAIVGEYAPMLARVATARRDPARAGALVERLLAPPGAGPTGDEDGELVALLKVDARFRELATLARSLDADVGEATQAVGLWRALGEAARSQSVSRAPSSPEAARLLEDVQGLTEAAMAQGRVPDKLSDLLLDATLAAYPPAGAGPYTAEAEAAVALGRRLSTLRADVAAAARTLGGAALGELEQRLRSVLGQARLVQIDGAVGKKKKLEVEIGQLSAGKIPASLFHKLQAEGAIGDDEEYWPFEGEYWSDEYTGYK
jgi:tetratricopeptide (TPR) repeat protein